MKNEKQTREHICSQIAATRKKQNLTISALAKLAGLNRLEVSRVEKNERSFGLDFLLKITNALNCKIKIEE